MDNRGEPINDSSALNQRISELEETLAELRNKIINLSRSKAELEETISELQKPVVRYEDRWLPRLTPILSILGLVQTIFIAAGIGFGWLGVSNILSAQNELDKIEGISRDVHDMNIQAKSEYRAQLDSITIAKQFIQNIVDSTNIVQEAISETSLEVVAIRKNVELRLNAILSQAQRERNTLRDSVNKELKLLENEIFALNSKIISLARDFSAAAKEGQASGLLNQSQVAFLFYLSTFLYQTVGLPIEKEGLHYYNLGIALSNIGKYEIAIESFNESLTDIRYLT